MVDVSGPSVFKGKPNHLRSNESKTKDRTSREKRVLIKKDKKTKKLNLNKKLRENTKV